MRAPAWLELDQVGLEFVRRLEAVDQGAQAPADDDALRRFAGDELLGREHGGRVDALPGARLPLPAAS